MKKSHNFCSKVMFHLFFPVVLCCAVFVSQVPAVVLPVLRNSPVNAVSTPFDTIQGAYSDPATVNTDVILCHEGLRGEDLAFTNPLDITLAGGYDHGFTGAAGITKVYGLKVSQGSLRVSQVAIVPVVCGNGLVESGEQCDDSNTVDGDGCSAACAPESGFLCIGTPSSCYSECGDGLVASNEGCDDNNVTESDGCSSTCTEEPGYTCIGSPSVCVLTIPGVAGITPGDAAASVTVPTDITVTFDSPMNNATLTAQTTAGPCSGSLQVSTDDFATCLGLQTPLLSQNGSGHTIATLTPAPALSYGTTYKLRVTSGAQNPLGNSCTTYTMSTGFTAATPGTQCSAAGSVVISQVYGGGGNSGSIYRNDFIELHNNTTGAVNIGGWSVQYASATGSTWASGITIIPNGVTIPAGGYYLIQEGAGTGGTTFLPTPDTAGSIAMAASAGKIALVNSTTALSGTCPTSAAIVDFVGYGGGVSCFEGTTAAPAPSNTTAVIRNSQGCQDGNQNSTDFVAAAPNPRNSATGANVCSYTANECGTAQELNFCNLQFPFSISVQAGQNTENVYGRVYHAGMTEAAGAAAGVVAEVGYGPIDVNPENQSGWQWFPASYNIQIGNEDEYFATFTAPESGTYHYTYRVSLDGGSHWTYCDLNGAGSNGGLMFEVTQLPVLTVN